MKTLILTNDLRKLRNGFKMTSQNVIYVNLSESQESDRICNYVAQHQNTKQIPIAPLLIRDRNILKETYCDLMARLNRQYHSLTWWAMPFTDKNAILRPIFADICHASTIQKLVLSSSENILIIIENPRLIEYLREWASSNNIRVYSLTRHPVLIKPFLQNYFLAGIIFAFAKTVALYLLCKIMKLTGNNTNPEYIITSLAHPRSFQDDNQYNDQYFGELVPHLSKNQSNYLILVLMIGKPFWQIKKIKNLQKTMQILPIESYLTLSDIFRCLARAIHMHLYNVSSQDNYIDDAGIDYNFFVNKTIQETCRSGSVLMNLRVYYAAKRLNKYEKITRCIYPYENRSWEKMLLLGMSQNRPPITMLGYQHASVSDNHFHLILSTLESEFTPLPHKILTTGPLVTSWFNNHGNYNNVAFTTACALRQNNTNSLTLVREKPIIRNLLIALATNIEEYVKILMFLGKAFRGDDIYQIRIRPHPAFKLKHALLRTPITQIPNYHESKDTLENDLKWADAVIYASSTVGLEAIAHGIPSVHIDLGDVLDIDPMLCSNTFQWSVAESSELKPTLNTIEAMTNTEYTARQTRGQTYSNQYLSPITDESMNLFLYG